MPRRIEVPAGLPVNISLHLLAEVVIDAAPEEQDTDPSSATEEPPSSVHGDVIVPPSTPSRSIIVDTENIPPPSVVLSTPL